MHLNFFDYSKLSYLLISSKLSIISVPQELHLISNGVGSPSLFVFQFMRNFSEFGGVCQDEPQVEPFSRIVIVSFSEHFLHVK